MERMEGLYQNTLAETQELLDPTQLDHATKLIANARQVDIYTGSHNLYPAGMFRDRLFSAGKSATCHDNVEAKVRTALASGPDHVAIAISYSGLVPNDYHGNADVLATPASGSHLRQGDAKRKGADLLVAPLKLNVRLPKCGPRSVGRLRRLVKRRSYS